MKLDFNAVATGLILASLSAVGSFIWRLMGIPCLIGMLRRRLARR